MITEFTCDRCGEQEEGSPLGDDEDLCVICSTKEEIDYIDSLISSSRFQIEIQEAQIAQWQEQKRKLLGIPPPPEPPSLPEPRVIHVSGLWGRL